MSLSSTHFNHKSYLDIFITAWNLDAQGTLKKVLLNLKLLLNTAPPRGQCLPPGQHPVRPHWLPRTKAGPVCILFQTIYEPLKLYIPKTCYQPQRVFLRIRTSNRSMYECRSKCAGWHKAWKTHVSTFIINRNSVAFLCALRFLQRAREVC